MIPAVDTRKKRERKRERERERERGNMLKQWKKKALVFVFVII